MLIQEKAGIITDVSELTKKDTGKKMIIISHTSGKSRELQKIFLFEGTEEFDGILMIKDEIIGQRISQKIVLGE